MSLKTHRTRAHTRALQHWTNLNAQIRLLGPEPDVLQFVTELRDWFVTRQKALQHFVRDRPQTLAICEWFVGANFANFPLQRNNQTPQSVIDLWQQVGDHSLDERQVVHRIDRARVCLSMVYAEGFSDNMQVSYYWCYDSKLTKFVLWSEFGLGFFTPEGENVGWSRHIRPILASEFNAARKHDNTGLLKVLE